jgi:diacylglycerol kinase family enzyme
MNKRFQKLIKEINKELNEDRLIEEMKKGKIETVDYINKLNLSQEAKMLAAMMAGYGLHAMNY